MRTDSAVFTPRLAADTPTNLRMSDWWLLAAFWLALAFLADPLGWRLEKQLTTKHLPLLLALGAALFVVVGHVIFPPEPGRRRGPGGTVLRAGLPLLLLGAWILAGSLYTRNANGINNTFLALGLYMLFALVLARVILVSPARDRIVRGFLLAAAAVAAFMIGRMAVEIGERNVAYHELEALTIPLAVYFAMRPNRSPNWHALLTMFFLLGGLVYRKNTGYLVMLATAAYLWFVHWRFRFVESPGFRRLTVIWLVVLASAAASVVAYRAVIGAEWFPSGNPQYRVKTYEAAWSSFKASPGWGNGFTASATEKFKDFDIRVARGVLPSHSDVLDLAAHGGVLALLLWVWAYLRAGRIAWTGLLRRRPVDDIGAAAHALACMNLTAIIVYAFNPIMLQPVKAFLLWGQFGLLLGLALHYGRDLLPAAAGARRRRGMPAATVPEGGAP